MGDFMFAIKMMVFTVILVLLMQIKIGPATLEQHSLAWMHRSSLIDNLQLVANGAIRVGVQGHVWLSSLFGTRMGERIEEEKEQAQEKESFWGAKRSDAYEKQQERKKRQIESEDAWEESSGPAGDEID